MLKNFPILLVASLALNAALLGVVGGRLLNGSSEDVASVNMEFARYGPASDVVQAAWAQLPEDDRVVLRKQLQASWEAMANDRKQLQETGRAVYLAALEEPFDETRLRNALIVFQHNEMRMQRGAEDILIRHLEGMPPEARATAAVGLLTPFNARAQRADQRAPKGERREPVVEGTDKPSPE
jgi:uncharacterized membrane protein